MHNLALLIEKYSTQIEFNILRVAADFAAQLQIDLYLVGGKVRDVLTGCTSTDLDLVVTGRVEEFARNLASRIEGEVTARSQFFTISIRSDLGIEVDIALARREFYDHPGELPRVESGSIGEDLSRRDFSINAMAVSLKKESWGDLIDPFGGRLDVIKGEVRVLHKNSFVDDATRIIRAIRYSSRYKFHLESNSLYLMKRDLPHLSDISGARLCHELERVFNESRVIETLLKCQEFGVLEGIHPALKFEPDTMLLLDESHSVSSFLSDATLLAMLVAYASDSERESLIDRLDMKGSWAKVTQDVGKLHGIAEEFRSIIVSRSLIFDLLNGLNPSAIEGFAMSRYHDIVRERLELYLTELRHVRPMLDGDDLMALGVPEGKAIGELLGEILEAKLNGFLASRLDEKKFVLEMLACE